MNTKSPVVPKVFGANRDPPKAKGKRMFLPIGFYSVVLFHIIFVTMTVAFVKAQQVDLQQVQEFVRKFNPNGRELTYNQLKLWFDMQRNNASQTNETGLYPRLFPFCVTYNQIMNTSHLTRPNSNIHKFADIFERVRDYYDQRLLFYHFNETRHSTLFNNKFITSVTLGRINPPDLDMINLRQWLHVTIKTQPLMGLYMQVVVGPTGLPLGELSLEFPCLNLPGSADMTEVGELVNCHYRPKGAVYHPRTYVAFSAKPRMEFHVHYKYFDITCAETPYIQFIFIAVKTFAQSPVLGEDYDLLFSPVFVNEDFDSDDGTPYPYHPSWKNEMLCSATDVAVLKTNFKGYPGKQKKNGDHIFAPIKWNISTDFFRLQPNELYDACVLGNKIPDPRQQHKVNIEKLECPPGPFRCTTSNKDLDRSNITASRAEALALEKDITQNCSVCAAPSCEEAGFSKQACDGEPSGLIVVNDSSIIENLDSVARVKSHGALSTLASLVLLPLANYIGRYYKEACRNCMCGNGPWIFIHIIFHLLSSAILWISIGPVVSAISNYQEVYEECQVLHKSDDAAAACATERSIGNPHVPLGVLVFVMQNLMIIGGFFRSSSNTIRMLQVVIHSHFGYLTFLLAGISAIVATLNNRCLEITALVTTLFVIPIIFFPIGCVMDCLTDKRVGIVPGRKFWPVLEPIKLSKRGPFECCKWIIFILFGIISFVVWILVAASSSLSGKVTKTDAFDPDNPSATLSSTFQGQEAQLVGLFSGVCGSVLTNPEDS